MERNEVGRQSGRVVVTGMCQARATARRGTMFVCVRYGGSSGSRQSIIVELRHASVTPVWRTRMLPAEQWPIGVDNRDEKEEPTCE